MKLKEIEEIIKTLESEKNVNDYLYNSVNIWPIIRKEIYFGLVYSKDEEKGNVAVSSKKDKESTVSYQPSKLNSILNWANIFFKYWKANGRLKRQLRKLKGLNIEALFLYQTASLYVDKIDGKKYDRFIDPYFDEVSKTHKSLKLHIEEVNTFPIKEYKNEPVVFDSQELIDLFTLKKLITDKTKSKSNCDTQEKLEEIISKVNNEISRLGSSFKLSFDRINYLINTIYLYEEFAAQVLKMLQPKVLFLVAYYSDNFQFSFIHKIKELDGKVVDIQHGKGNINYEYWNHESKYLPDYLWTWSVSKCLDMQMNSFLKPILGGNLWMRDYAIKNKSNGDKVKVTEGKKILVAFQVGFAHLLMPILLPLIEMSPSDWNWLIKFHPVTGEKERKEIRDELKDFQNLKFEQAENLELYDLFNLVDFQITAYSTTALEGLEFNVPCVITSEAGFHAFKQLIENGALSYSMEPIEILEILKSNNPIEGFDNFRVLQKDVITEQAINNIFV